MLNAPDGWDLMYHSWVTSSSRGVGRNMLSCMLIGVCECEETSHGQVEQVF